MGKKFNYTTSEYQVKKLKNQGLLILDEDFAKTSLEMYGYSNLIKSYRDPYIIMSSQGKIYRTGVTFEQICSLYLFDKQLRNAVMSAMTDFEEYLKSAVAEVISRSFGTDQQDYLAFRNYRDRKTSKNRFSLQGILDSLNNSLNSDKNPVCHYRVKYGIVPPWILFKNIYFSTIINFIRLFKRPQKIELAKRLYNSNTLHISDDEVINLMTDTLFVFLEYRNLAAHGGRVYNYKTIATVRLFDNNSTINGISALLHLLDLLDYNLPFTNLSESLNYLLTMHCSQYPEDITYLSQILNLNIVRKDNVWISNSKKLYHSYEHCSGMKNAQQIELNEAIEMGYTPCKKCYSKRNI